MRITICLVVLSSSLMACGGDVRVERDGAVASDAGPDGSSGCTGRPEVAGIVGSTGLVIARDGTLYFTHAGGIGRLAAGARQDTFVISAAPLSALALDAANTTLFVAMPGSGIGRVDLGAVTPAIEPFVNDLGAPYALTLGPDGGLYYADANSGNVYRVSLPDAARTTVSGSPVTNARSIAFEPSGSLQVGSWGTGRLLRLTLAGGSESDRQVVSSALSNPIGLAVAADGRILVADEGGAFDAGVYVVSGTGETTPLRTGLGVPAKLELGAGVLPCEDLYVAITNGPMARIDDVGPGAALPWH